jgi:GNAT superfamily N-acetyltransferase
VNERRQAGENATVTTVQLRPLEPAEEPAFIVRLQEAFTAGAEAAEPGHAGSEPVISVGEIRESIDAPGADSWNVLVDGQSVGGAVVSMKDGGRRRSLDLLFMDTAAQGRGVGSATWRALEEHYPDAEVWETMTPYFDTRNIHFYVNRCGFHIVEFFHPGHPDPNSPHPTTADDDERGPDLMFRFEKRRS